MAKSERLINFAIIFSFVSFLVWLALTYPYINNDCGLYIQCGRELLHGRTAYTQIFDTNPPLTFCVGTLVAFVAQNFQISEILTFDVLVALVVAVACLICHLVFRSLSSARKDPGHDNLITLADPQEPNASAQVPIPERLFVLIVPLVICTFMLMTGPDTGQRDQLMVVLFVPYLLTRWLACSKELPNHVSAIVRLACGLLCGIAVSLKPHFYLLPLALENLLALRTRKQYVWFCPETVGIASAIALYILAVLLLPNLGLSSYIHEIVPLVRNGYDVYGISLAASALQKLLICSPLLLFLPQLKRLATQSTLVAALLAALAGAFIEATLQSKDYIYHLYPCLLLTMLLLAAVMLMSFPKQAMWTSLLSGGLCLICACALVMGTNPNKGTHAEVLIPLLKKYSNPGDRVAILGPDNNIGTLMQLDRRNCLYTYPYLIILPLLKSDIPANPGMDRWTHLQTSLTDEIGSELRQSTPALILISTKSPMPLSLKDFNTFEALGQSQSLTHALNNCVLIGNIDNYNVYVIKKY